MVVGFFTSIATPNTHEARASFVVPTDVAQIEYERMISRSLVTKAVNSESRFEVSNYVDGGLRDRINMYDGSPFQIRILDFPSNIRNKSHDIILFPDHGYELRIHAAETTLSKQGKAGVPLSLGSVRLIVDATQFWDDKATQAAYSFVVQSKEALATRFLSQLTVVHSLDHPNRISLYYKDAHPNLALDLLTAFTTAYLDDCAFRRNEFLRERKMEVEGRLRVLETEILRSEDTTFWENLSKESLLVSDSSIVQILKLRQASETLLARQQIWEGYRRGDLSPENLLDELRMLDPHPQDTALMALLTRLQKVPEAGREAMIAQSTAMVDSLRSRDLGIQKEMDAQAAVASADFLASAGINFTWKTSLGKRDGNTINQNVVLLEKFLASLSEVSRIELETRQTFSAPQLIDPPYLMPGHGRNIKIRTLVATILGLTMLAIFAALMASLAGKRFGSLRHFQVATGIEDLATWSHSAGEELQRKQATLLELSLRPEDKLIALVGETPEVDQLASALAGGFITFGRRVLVLNSVLSNEEMAWEHMIIPQSSQPGWWFSAQAAAFLREKTAAYDRVLLCLPPPRKAPEVSAVIRQANLTYFIVKQKATKVAEWRTWKSLSEELGIEGKPFFVSR